MAMFKLEWPTYGVTIMCYSWTRLTHTSIINNMIYCNGTMFFHKSINVMGLTQNASYFCKEIASVVDKVGPRNMMQIVTNNGADYKKACRLIARKHRNIVW